MTQGVTTVGMEAGALGMSAGLEYVPGRWSNTDEVVAVVEEIVPFGGVFIEHERSSGTSPMWWRPSQDEPGPPTMLNSIQETIEIGERTGATVVATHIKAWGANYWGSSGAIIGRDPPGSGPGRRDLRGPVPVRDQGKRRQREPDPRMGRRRGRSSGRRRSGRGRTPTMQRPCVQHWPIPSAPACSGRISRTRPSSGAAPRISWSSTILTAR